MTLLSELYPLLKLFLPLKGSPGNIVDKASALIGLFPNDKAALRERAEALVATGRKAEAEADFGRLMAFDFKVGRSLGHPFEALRDYSTIVLSRSKVRASRGNISGAIDDVSKVIGWDPLNPDFYHTRSELYALLGWINRSG